MALLSLAILAFSFSGQALTPDLKDLDYYRLKLCSGSEVEICAGIQMQTKSKNSEYFLHMDMGKDFKKSMPISRSKFTKYYREIVGLAGKLHPRGLAVASCPYKLRFLEKANRKAEVKTAVCLNELHNPVGSGAIGWFNKIRRTLLK